MYKQKCNDESQVQMHLESLLHIQEQLAGIGVGLTDLDLVMVILRPFPKSYCPLINAIRMSSAHAKVMLKLGKVIESQLMSLSASPLRTSSSSQHKIHLWLLVSWQITWKRGFKANTVMQNAGSAAKGGTSKRTVAPRSPRR